jgi:hypothetical protein
MRLAHVRNQRPVALLFVSATDKEMFLRNVNAALHGFPQFTWLVFTSTLCSF